MRPYVVVLMGEDGSHFKDVVGPFDTKDEAIRATIGIDQQYKLRKMLDPERFASFEERGTG